MNIKKFGKGLLVMTLATTMALSTPMAAFAQGTATIVEKDNEEWSKFVDQLVDLLYNHDKPKQELADELNKFVHDDETSTFEELYEYLEKEEKEIFKIIDDRFEELEAVREIAKVIVGDTVLTKDNITAEKAINRLNKNKDEIIEYLKDNDMTVEYVKSKLNQVNTFKNAVSTTKLQFLSYDENFKVEDDGKLKELMNLAKNHIKDEEIRELVTPERFNESIDKFNDKASSGLKDNMKEVFARYKLLVDDDSGSGDSIGGSTGGGGGGGGGGSPADDASEDISSGLEDLTKEDANVDEITETILKDIEKLTPKQAKNSADDIVSSMMDVIKQADFANAKKAKDSTVKLVEALVSRVTTQKVEVKDGKASLSSSKAKEQIKDAQEIIEELTKAAKDSGIQLTKIIKPTLNFEVDKDIKDFAIEVTEELWNEINGQANISVKTKGVELILEHNTFKEKTYTINIKEDKDVVELTTDANFARPIKVIFPVDKDTSFPSVYQIVDGDNKLVGGVYNPETKTLAVTLKHFSFYTVKTSFPQTFNDINELTWERKAIDELSARGYLAGMPGNLYAPHESTTRAEFAAMLTRVMPAEEAEKSSITFTDLKEDAWYYKSIATAVNQGWLVGRDNNKFDPSAPVTRQEVASVLSRVLVEKGYLETSDDVKAVNVAPWAKDSVGLLLREIDVRQISELDMSSPATRAEVAVMIYEILSK